MGILSDLWRLVIFGPLLNALLFLYQILGHNFALAIAAVTIILRLATQPLMAGQMKTSRKMQEIQPLLKELEKKYANDKERLSQEQMKLYKEHGINPLGGCLPMLLQFPIWIALYQGITQALGRTPIQLLALSKHVYHVGLFASLPLLIPLSSHFLWLDLGRPDPYYILPILTAATMWVQQKMMTPASSGDNDSAQTMNQSMQMTMPLMFAFITFNLASGLALYFVISNLMGVVVQYFMTGWGSLEPQIAAFRRLVPALAGGGPARTGGGRPTQAAAKTEKTAQPAASQPAASVQKGTKSGSRKKKR